MIISINGLYGSGGVELGALLSKKLEEKNITNARIVIDENPYSFCENDTTIIKVFTKASPSTCRKNIREAYDPENDENLKGLLHVTCRCKPFHFDKVTDEELEERIDRINTRRADTYKSDTGKEWGSEEDYDYLIDVDALGLEGAAQQLAEYVAAAI